MNVKFTADIECLAWLPPPYHNHLLLSLENGFVFCYDILKGLSQPLWKLQAHNGATQALAASPLVAGLIATGSTDKNSPLKV